MPLEEYPINRIISSNEPLHNLVVGLNRPHLGDIAWVLVNDFPVNMKVLFTSGYSENIIASHGVLDEGLNFISKPYTPQALAQMVREVLDK